MLQRDQGRLVFKSRIGSIDSVLVGGVSISSIHIGVRHGLAAPPARSQGEHESAGKQSYESFVTSNLLRISSTFEHAVESRHPRV